MSKEIINALSNGDNLAAESEFNDALSAKVGSALETKRKDASREFKVKENELLSYFEKEMLSI